MNTVIEKVYSYVYMLTEFTVTKFDDEQTKSNDLSQKG